MFVCLCTSILLFRKLWWKVVFYILSVKSQNNYFLSLDHVFYNQTFYCRQFFKKGKTRISQETLFVLSFGKSLSLSDIIFLSRSQTGSNIYKVFQTLRHGWWRQQQSKRMYFSKNICRRDQLADCNSMKLQIWTFFLFSMHTASRIFFLIYDGFTKPISDIPKKKYFSHKMNLTPFHLRWWAFFYSDFVSLSQDRGKQQNCTKRDLYNNL